MITKDTLLSIVLLKFYSRRYPYLQQPKVLHYGGCRKENFSTRCTMHSENSLLDGKNINGLQINVKISSDAKAPLDRLTRELKTTQQAVLEHLIQNHRLVIQNPQTGLLSLLLGRFFFSVSGDFLHFLQNSSVVSFSGVLCFFFRGISDTFPSFCCRTLQCS